VKRNTREKESQENHYSFPAFDSIEKTSLLLMQTKHLSVHDDHHFLNRQNHPTVNVTDLLSNARDFLELFHPKSLITFHHRI